MPPATLRVEFHCHTRHSPDSLVRPAALVAAARRKGIDRLVVTDHNRIAGALEAWALDPALVIVGEEIMTTEGELLAAFVTELVPSRLAPLEAIARLKAQGAFISVSHPFDRRRSPWTPAALAAILPHIDAIETYNARCLSPAYNQRAAAFAAEHGLAGTAGSDAHTFFELGRATMRLPAFQDAAGLRAAMQHVQHETRSSGLLARLGSRWASLVNKLSG